MRNLCIGLLLLCSCYGTFRTARAVPKDRWSVDINWMFVQDENKKYNYYDSPSLVIRRGVERGGDLGIKLLF